MESVRGTINVLGRYLDDNGSQYPSDMRVRQVKDLLAEMRERGRMLSTDPRYGMLNEFYQQRFDEVFPAWVEERISIRRAV